MRLFVVAIFLFALRSPQVPKQQQQQADKQNSIAQEPSNPVPVTVIINHPPAKEQAKYPNAEAQHWNEWVSPIANLALVFAAFWAAKIAAASLHEVQRQAKATEDAAKAASDNANAAFKSTEALLLSQRAWIFPHVERQINSRGTFFTFWIKNYGHTPATLISIRNTSLAIAKTEHLETIPDYGIPSRFQDVIILKPGEQIPYDEIELSVLWWAQNTPDWQNIINGQMVSLKTVVHYGIIEYKDVFPDSPIRYTRYSFRYFDRLNDYRVRGESTAYTQYT